MALQYDKTILTDTQTFQVLTVHIHEIDWDYDFGNNPVKELLIKAAENVGVCQATTDSGWPRVGWHDVMSVGMVSQWPYWTPRPCVMVNGMFGTEWYDWNSLTGVEVNTDKSSPPKVYHL